ncbi:5-oxoprolinase subunit PxpA [Vibrio viridaestus]|uniref:5-oxoprolinase subunit A n=1 Tax=Vibrio viridaestus TaxID=2487322 RepID=A0A3N9TDA4_9VIBR|nr:5-oxoprolinase subunit PxpA [Vibrio viridaestus]RQW62030.1 LamB/YcsF family protein [Vibrio viridaestus]
MAKVDLNCDMGESFGTYTIGSDDQIIKHVSSVNIACGFHAGDPTVMRKTVKMAKKNNVAVGAHPGFDDLKGFGRRNIAISSQEAYDIVTYQVGALYGFTRSAGVPMHHVKPHGALYNMAAKDSELSLAIAQAVYDISPELILYGLAGSELIKAGQKTGLRVYNEVFADRTYQSDGSLTPRAQPNALLESDQDAVDQVLNMVLKGQVKATNGEWINVKADTICIHGDGAHALSFAEKVMRTLKHNGVQVMA